MIRFENLSGSGLEWPEHGVAIKPGANEFSELPPAMVNRFKVMHENNQGVLELPGFKCVNGAWVVDEPPAPAPVAESKPQGNSNQKR